MVPCTYRWGGLEIPRKASSRTGSSALRSKASTLSHTLDLEQDRLQRLYGEFPGGSAQGRYIKRQIREVAGRSGSVKASAMVRRNQDDAERIDEPDRDTDSSNQSRNS